MFNTSWRFFIRSVMQHRSYTLLNVLGLAVGLAVTLLVVLFLRNELTYDTRHPESDRIYRLTSYFYFETENHHYAPTGLGLAPLMQGESDAIEAYVRVGNAGKNVLLKHGQDAFYEDAVFYADSTYFDFFPSTFIYGDASDALRGENSLVLTQSLATSIFGDVNPVGEVLRTNSNRFVVTGVIEDLPQNEHIQFKALLPAFTEQLSQEDLVRTLWAASTFTYIRLKEGVGPSEINRAFREVHQKYMVDVASVINSDYDIIVEPLEEVHYGSKAEFDLPKGKLSYLFVFGGVGLLILALAMINYMNLATARASKRAKEIGVRKVLGSTRRDLIWQLLIESVTLTFVGLFLAVILVELLLQSEVLIVLMQKNISINVIDQPKFLWWGVITALVVGILSGIYPALYLSRIEVAESLKSAFKAGKSSVQMRRFLVGLQFTFSISVVVLAVFMTRQMSYMSDRYLGFNSEDIVLVPVQDTALREVVPEMIEELREQPHVLSVSSARNVPGDIIGRVLMHALNPQKVQATREAMDIMHVGEGYFHTMELEFLQGSSYTAVMDEDSVFQVVVNESLVEYFGWDDPIGEQLEWGLQENGRAYYTARIIGVVNDFNTSSLHSPVNPLVMFLDEEQRGTLHLRVDSENMKSAIASIEKVWNQHSISRPFEFSFLDEDLDMLYREDQRQSTLISMLTLVTILISTLGLLGLASYTIQQRYKEIGIRKVLGASVRQIVNLLFRDVAAMVALAVLISIPISYAVFQSWVSNFAYVTPVQWFVFVVIGLIAVIFSYVVVSLHSLKAARTNPVKSLKYE
ncbi:FtsX-like permease family protein [Phaeocystidibacter marisrubri]|uniref:FtsX-like permease family protein n=2 Tax=Phaeocystidibacter marisrubri TaxID=1577780 RepID=A0A6L3ZI91_9FLAO|nr:FtsX-like permease family protein [Phaeocystidibacter marisrubri]